MTADDARCVTALRFLAVDMVERAKSGHPGLPLGAGPMAYVLWDRVLRHDPQDPGWWDRDRFVLSAGHGCALLYALLHLTGYDLPMEELQRFRQWGSRTPGHPEYRHTQGVEATTGPLGQGFAMGVGMAIAERFLAARFNQPGFPIIDHRTFIIAGDGDLMEGVSSEAASLAGTLRLGKLLVLYDDNHITIEGSTGLAFTEDVGARFEAYGWRVLHVSDGNDLEAIAEGLRDALSQEERPTIIAVRTHIGFGSSKADTAEAHGEPLGPEVTRATKRTLGWPEDPPFLVPDDVRARFRQGAARGAAEHRAWKERFTAYRARHPDLATALERAMRGDLPPRWDAALPTFPTKEGGVATRDASGKTMNAIAKAVPNFLGGSADLAPSTKTLLDGAGDVGPTPDAARNLHFGVREHAMCAAVNGMAAHGGVVPFGATFLVFSDYARPALRIAALMQAHSIFVFTHESIGLGEDGPTHQPVEHLMSLRLIPGVTLLRPADANETAAAWRIAMKREGPVCLALTRQKLPVLDPARFPIAEGVPRGAYVLLEAEGGKPDLVLLGTGSEVHLCIAARERLARRGVRARVVSMPSWELFEEQPAPYRASVLPVGVPRLAVEAGVTNGWERYTGAREAVVGLNRFGASAPGAVVMEHLGFTPEHVEERALALLEKVKLEVVR